MCASFHASAVDARAVDPERIQNQAILWAIEGDSKKSHDAVARGSELDRVRTLRHLERFVRGARFSCARCDFRGARSIDPELECAAVRLLVVIDFDLRCGRGDLGPRACFLLREQTHSAEPQTSVAFFAPDIRSPLAAHSRLFQAFLQIRAPRFSEVDEAATAVAESRLQGGSNRSRFEIRHGVRIAVHDDAHVARRFVVVEQRALFVEAFQITCKIQRSRREGRRCDDNGTRNDSSTPWHHGVRLLRFVRERSGLPASASRYKKDDPAHLHSL